MSECKWVLVNIMLALENLAETGMLRTIGDATTIVDWRRGRDSNPRYPCEYAAFRVRCFQPLSHLSEAASPSARLLIRQANLVDPVFTFPLLADLFCNPGSMFGKRSNPPPGAHYASPLPSRLWSTRLTLCSTIDRLGR